VKLAGAVMLVAVAVLALAAPWLAPNAPERRFDDLMLAPPTRIYVYDDGLTAPFIYRWRLLSRIEYRFEEARPQRVPLRWLTREALVTSASGEAAPLLLLGADGYGRDIFARLVHGARPTLALALLATLGAILGGVVIGGVAGYAGGWVDGLLSRVSEFVLVLPAIYVALALRAVMPLVLPPLTVFVLLTAIFTVFGWPIVARGVRAIVVTEREREYVVAARAAGASNFRMLTRHLLPAARGYLATQATLLLPAFIVAEATLSYIGLGFPDTVPTWGTMLLDAANIALLESAPWTLAPAAAIFVVVLGVNLVVQAEGRPPVQFD
jgi:peptide/nickel transport system permease protein